LYVTLHLGVPGFLDLLMVRTGVRCIL